MFGCQSVKSQCGRQRQVNGDTPELNRDAVAEAPQSFEPDELSRQLTMLHDQIDRFFYWSSAPGGADYFGTEVLQ